VSIADMAKPNYSFEKRQKEIAKKKKQDEKRAQKLAGRASENGEPQTEAANDSAKAPQHP